MPNRLSRRHLLTLIVSACAVGPVLTTTRAAQAATLVELRHIAGIATLAHRIGRAAFYAALRLEEDAHYQMLSHSAGDLDARLSSLPSLPASDPDAATLTSYWSTAKPAIAQAVAAKTLPDPMLEDLAEAITALGTAAEAVAATLAGGFDPGQHDPQVAAAILTLASLATGSQALAASAAQSTLGIQTATAQADLNNRMAAFDTRLADLHEGQPGTHLSTAPQLVQPALDRVDALWLDYRLVAASVGLIGIASEFELNALSAQADPLMVAIDAVAELYLPADL